MKREDDLFFWKKFVVMVDVILVFLENNMVNMFNILLDLFIGFFLVKFIFMFLRDVFCRL